MKNGGARPGAGRPKGSLNKLTKEIRDSEKQYKRRVAGMADKLLNVQASQALGEKNLFVTRTTGSGKNKRRETTMVEDVEVVKQYLNGDFDGQSDEYYFIATKSPDTKALDSMLDRTYGKARQSVDVTSGDEPIQADPVSAEVLAGFEEFMLAKTMKGKTKDDK